MGSSLERETWIKIIKLYRSISLLWNKHDINYSNHVKRKQGYKLLLKVYRTLEPHGTIDAVKKRLENMRTAYNRELKKVNASKLLGEDEIYQPSLWYFDAFSFLNPDEHIFEEEFEIAKTQVDLEKRDIFEEDDHQSIQLSSYHPSDTEDSATESKPRVTYRRSFSRRIQNQDIMEESPQQSKRRRMSSNQEYFEALGRSVGYQLESLERHQLTITEKLIADAIFYGRMGRLTEESTILLSDPLNQQT